jgi:alcohol dehydrogenase
MSDKAVSTTVFDGLCTAVEAYCSTKANFFSDALLEQAVSLYCKVLASASEGRNFEIAPNIVNAGVLLALGATFSAPGIGTALSCALSGKFPVAKSWCATVILPHIMERFIAARPDKMAVLASLMGESPEGASMADIANMAVDTVRRYMGKLQVPARLKELNLSLDRLAPSAESARNLEFTAFSPWTVSSDDSFDILKQAF